MTDILARIRAWAGELSEAPESMLGPFLAAEIRRRFLEAFAARPMADAQAPASTVLVPGSPEQVATMLLATGPCYTQEIVKACIAAGAWDRSRISDDLTDALKVAGMAYWDSLGGGRWVITAAGLAEAERHASAAQAVEVRPAKMLETGSPEQAALAYLAMYERLEAWEIHYRVKQANALPPGYSQERLVRNLKKKGLAVWKANRWHITDAGRAEDAKHEVKP